MPLRAFQLVLLVLALHLPSAGQSSWENENEAGEKAFREGRYSDAAQRFREALNEAQQFGSNDVRLAPIYNNLALLSFVQNDFVASEALFQKAIAVLGAQGETSPLLLPVLDNLTSLYLKQWAFGKAIQTTWRSCQIREKKFGPDSLETATGLNKLGTLYLDSVRLLSESPSAASAPSTSQPLLANASAGLIDLSAAYGNSASLDDTTKLRIAEWLFNKVLAVLENAYGRDSARLVDVLENRAEAQYRQGKIGSAKEAYARVIAIDQKSFGPDDLKLLEPLQQAAELETEAGKYAEAEKLYQQALRIGEARLGASSPALNPVLTGYAALFQRMNQPEEANKLIARANALAPAKSANLLPLSSSIAVPYILRFDKSVSDHDAGAERITCTLVRADGRFRVEEQLVERPDQAIGARVQRPPDGMPDMSGLQETFAQRSGSGTNAPKVYEGTLPGDALQQLRAILSAQAIRDLRGNYTSHGGRNDFGTERIDVSILRDEGVQDFGFPNSSAREPYDQALHPLFKWVSTAQKHKGSPVKGVTSNHCTPDAPAHVLLQFSAARTNLLHSTGAPEKTNASSHDANLSPTSTIKVQVNLVLARVVVRDKQGRAVGNLRQEDFQLKDNGQARTITKFSFEQPGSNISTQADSPRTPVAVAGPGTKTTEPVQSVAFLFDDLHMDAADFNLIRAAADRHLTSLPATVEAAVFTTSGQVTQGFTAVGAQLHDALFRIHPLQAASSAENHCPEIDTYLADLIWNQHDEEALGSATQDALVCAFGNDPRFARAAENLAKATAQQRLASAQAEIRTVLGAFQQAVVQLAPSPGRHVLVLISPGFVCPDHEQDFNQFIDRVLQSDIVINTMDVSGLSPPASVIQSASPNPSYRQESSSASQGILMTLANATGGTAFHGNNDFAAGFQRVEDPPESYYVLGFSPREEEMDGRFHNLSVRLNSDEKLILQVRKGFYAKKN